MLLDEVDIFTVLAETKSLSQAAKNLHLSRPGLSQKIAKIEKDYAVKLYERTSTGIELTRAGQTFAKFAKSVSALEKTLYAELEAGKETFNSTIEVGISFADGEALLPGIVKQYRDLYPHEYIHLDAGYEPELIEKLRDGLLDFALLENCPIEDGITRETLGYKRLIFLAPNKPPYSTASQPIAIQTLFEWPCVSYERDSGFHLIGNRIFRERYNIALRSEVLVVQFDTWESRISGIKHGLGWAAMPEVIAERHYSDPELIKLKLDTDPLFYPVDIAWCENHTMPDRARQFAAFVKEHIPEGYFSSAYQESTG